MITGWITKLRKNTIHDGARSQTIHAGGGLFGANGQNSIAMNLKGIGVMKKSPGMPPGANTINPAVIEGGRHPHLLQMNVDYGLLFITYRTKVMNL